MDNATSEYSFITRFFDREAKSPGVIPLSTLTPVSPRQEESSTEPERVESPVPTARAPSAPMSTLQAAEVRKLKEEQAYFDDIFKQVMEPVLQYTEVHIAPYIPDMHLSAIPRLSSNQQLTQYRRQFHCSLWFVSMKLRSGRLNYEDVPRWKHSCLACGCRCGRFSRRR
jgi:hypothetical protein